MDNTAIARIATPDLSSQTLCLIEEYFSNDDVIFFLGRLVWQARMTNCVPALTAVAIDPGRGHYARVASIRAVMSSGAAQQRDYLWEAIAHQPVPLEPGLLGELLEWSTPSSHTIDLLLQALDAVVPHDDMNPSGLEEALVGFADRLPMMADDASDQPLARLVDGLRNFLQREPFIERGECHVSSTYAWLMVPALHAVDRLVAARSAQALMPAALDVMQNVPALRFWQRSHSAKYRSSLDANVPRWPELNDTLFWASVSSGRSRLAKSDHRLTDDWQISYLGHFWRFGSGDFTRCLDWIRTKAGDDKLVALSRCIRLYVEADRPLDWLRSLREVVLDEPPLMVLLDASIDPRPRPAEQRMNEERTKRDRERESRSAEEDRNRSDWVRRLKANPDTIRHPTGLKPGEMSHDQLHLLMATRTSGSTINRTDDGNWRALIGEFGEDVARAYRDAAAEHWRAYKPMLRSEGAKAGSIPYSLIFGMAGLAIETEEDKDFVRRLTQDEARLAFRYVTWELNGFPAWFESLYRTFNGIGLDAVERELLWELEQRGADKPLHYVLHDILYYAPWLHAEVASVILAWLKANDMPDEDALQHCLNILTSSGASLAKLSDLARFKIQGSSLRHQRPRWFALWVDAESSPAIRELERELGSLSLSDATTFAQKFVVGLLGDRHGTATRFGAFRNARDLKQLYILMHRYIRADDDIERAGTGVYSPELRDNAQDARNKLFDMLSSVPGGETYAAIKALEKEHPSSSYRKWMAVRARERATTDADEPLWTTEEVQAFADGFARK